MGYWKREYTERKNGKPLFVPEAKRMPRAKPPAPDDENVASDDQPAEAPTHHTLAPETTR
jgi:hypothetical protein